MNDWVEGMPPYSLEVERCLLACFIVSDDAAVRRDIIAKLPAHGFFLEDHHILAGQMYEMFQAGKSIDAITVADQLRASKLTAKVGGIAYIGEILSRVPSASHWKEYLTRAVNLWRCRQVIAAAEGAAVSLRRGTVDPIDVARGLRNELDAMLYASNKSVQRGGGAAELNHRLDDMIAGRVRNIDWPNFKMLSKLARALESSSITMLSGSPGDGKTFLLLQSLIGWQAAGVRVSICMLEKTRPWHLLRCLAVLEGNPSLMKSEWVSDVFNRDAVNMAKDRWAKEIESLGESIYEAREVGDDLGSISDWVDVQADDGADIIIIDPISLADAGDKRWIADGKFIKRAIRACEKTNTRVLCVTHPNTTQGPAKLSSLMGGTTYQRATDTVLHITKFDKPEKFSVMRSGYPNHIQANRMMSCFKGRNGEAGGYRFAMNFDGQLRYSEEGVIVKEANENETASGIKY